jgi:phosphatidyl-myo-inositol dimannoside synthase
MGVRGRAWIEEQWGWDRVAARFDRLLTETATPRGEASTGPGTGTDPEAGTERAAECR